MPVKPAEWVFPSITAALDLDSALGQADVQLCGDLQGRQALLRAIRTTESHQFPSPSLRCDAHYPPGSLYSSRGVAGWDQSECDLDIIMDTA